jgi:hypothetical protein
VKVAVLSTVVCLSKCLSPSDFSAPTQEGIFPNSRIMAATSLREAAKIAPTMCSGLKTRC